MRRVVALDFRAHGVLNARDLKINSLRLVVALQWPPVD